MLYPFGSQLFLFTLSNFRWTWPDQTNWLCIPSCKWPSWVLLSWCCIKFLRQASQKCRLGDCIRTPKFFAKEKLHWMNIVRADFCSISAEIPAGCRWCHDGGKSIHSKKKKLNITMKRVSRMATCSTEMVNRSFITNTSTQFSHLIGSTNFPLYASYSALFLSNGTINCLISAVADSLRSKRKKCVLWLKSFSYEW